MLRRDGGGDDGRGRDGGGGDGGGALTPEEVTAKAVREVTDGGVVERKRVGAMVLVVYWRGRQLRERW